MRGTDEAIVAREHLLRVVRERHAALEATREFRRACREQGWFTGEYSDHAYHRLLDTMAGAFEYEFQAALTELARHDERYRWWLTGGRRGVIPESDVEMVAADRGAE